jgi:glycosyltransferase involved in cell wall biosynthesis
MNPKISVIVPAYNEEKLLPTCLEALQRQDYPKEQFEVIIVDNGSSDQTAHVAKKFGMRVYTYTDIQGCGASRKFGILHAKGSIIALTDADCVAASDWLTKIDKRFTDPKLVCVGGSAIPKTKKLLPKLIFSFFDLFHLTNHLLGKPLMGGYNMAVRKSAYEKVGGIKSDLLSCDDWELALNLKNHFGRQSVRYDVGLQVFSATRKQEHFNDVWRFAKEGLQNYIRLVILNKKKVAPTFTVR